MAKHSATYYIATAIETIGIMLVFGSMIADPAKYPLLGIPIIVGLFALLSGVSIEKGWCESEEGDYEDDKSNGGCIDSDDSGITYITYDSAGTARDFDFR